MTPPPKSKGSLLIATATPIIRGETGRTGYCELADLPLAEGTNWLTLTMTDAAGNIATTNVFVIGSPLKLTVDHLSWDEMMEQSQIR